MGLSGANGLAFRCSHDGKSVHIVNRLYTVTLLAMLSVKQSNQ